MVCSKQYSIQLLLDKISLIYIYKYILHESKRRDFWKTVSKDLDIQWFRFHLEIWLSRKLTQVVNSFRHAMPWKCLRSNANFTKPNSLESLLVRSLNKQAFQVPINLIINDPHLSGYMYVFDKDTYVQYSVEIQHWFVLWFGAYQATS